MSRNGVLGAGSVGRDQFSASRTTAAAPGRTCAIALACLVVTGVTRASCATEPVGSIPTRLSRVALFKNGLGFFVREGSLDGGNRAVLLGPFAAPAHGTFWVSAPAAAGLKSVVARSAVVKGSPLAAKDMPELIRANIGAEILVWPTPDSTAPVKGVIMAVAPDRPAPVVQPRAYELGGALGREIIPPWGQGEYVLVRGDEGVVAFGLHSIARMRFTSDDVATRFQPEVLGAELEAVLTSSKRGDWVSVSYLAKGITWAPSYLVDMSDPKQARLAAKAEVINEAEDLQDTHLDLITGYPNLRFADIFSPMAMRTDLATFLQSLAGGGARPEAAGVMTQAVMYRAEIGIGGDLAGAPGPPGLTPFYGAAAAGQTAEDLFLYPVEDVTLARGETGYYPLFTESVPYTEFYDWEVPDYINPSEHYIEQEPQKPEIVWHSIRLANTTGVPWTTAPVQVAKNGRILGQDVLSFTPTGAKATVKITQAASVKAEQSEIEAERERDAVVLYGSHFDRVSIEGELRVANYQHKAITLEIRKTLSGEVKAASPAAKDVTLARGLRRMNPVHELTWTVSLQAQETQKITYRYQALIRR